MEDGAKTTDFSDHVYAAIAEIQGGVVDISFEILCSKCGLYIAAVTK